MAASRAATAEFSQLARTALVVMRHLDALNRIRFGDDPERLAELDAALNGRWGGAERMAG